MTTIVYDHKNKQIAVDSRATRGDIICSDSESKFEFIDGQIWFFSGVIADKELLVSWFSDKEQKPTLVPECCSIVIIKGKAYLNTVGEHGAAYQSELTFSDAIGSGSSFALAALDHGKTAKQAVEYAAKRDPFTGGKITVFDVETGKIVDA